jgi:hypothetical protein
LIALLSYPVLIEPLVGLRQQGWVWMAGYGMFAALAVGSVVLARRVGLVEGGGAASEHAPRVRSHVDLPAAPHLHAKIPVRMLDRLF